MEIIQQAPPTVSAGATQVVPDTVNRYGSNTTVISASFSDADVPGIGAFNVTFKIREPNNSTELTLVNNQPNGSGGLSISDDGGGNYTASYTYDPIDTQTLGMYDLYFEVTDGSDNAIDGYSPNSNELEINEIIANEAPIIVAGTTSVNPGSIDRSGAITTDFSATFTDVDDPGASSFYVTFRARSQYFEEFYFVSDAYQHGQSGMVITDNGDSSYTATMAWDPPDNAYLGYYDLYCLVSDGIASVIDSTENNQDELLVTNGGENAPPVVPADNVFASPAGVERIGANSATFSATFTDSDIPGVSAFQVSFKLRLPDNSSELILADNVFDGQGGVAIADGGSGVYTASISWDPPDAQTLGFYDISFQVNDGADTSYDSFSNNLDELEIYDAITNNPPLIVADTTYAVPNSVNRVGSEYTMIRSAFRDVDMPGRGAFTVTIKVRDQLLAEDTLVNAARHGEQGLRIIHQSGDEYEATVLWYPPDGQATGTYDLYFYVEDNSAASAVDGFGNNADELTVTSTSILGDGNILRRTNDSDNCGGPNTACHNIANHQTFNCRTCHTPHSTSNIYMVRDSIQTPNSGTLPVIFKTLGIGDAFNPDPSPGDPTSGVLADSTDGVFTGVCEVCHTTTGHHRNDGSQPPPNHNDALDCTSCHPHTEGFAVSGGGESSGGQACVCHSSIFAGMDSTSIKHRHILADTQPDYSPGVSDMYAIKNCLTCHVDHDIFRDDLNPGIGLRGKNLRVDWATDPVQGSDTVLSNSDYSSAGMGGICLSCHAEPSCLGCHSAHINGPGGPPMTTSSFGHTQLNKPEYDAATATHNYDVPSTYSSDGSTFNSNCSKCHDDNMAKSYQNSTYKFSTHGSDYSQILDPVGVSGPSDPLEEKFCFKCHSTTSNPNAGSNLDYYGVQSITNQDALDLEAVFSRTYTHPTATYSGRHSTADSVLSLGDGNRHAECGDCHSVHAALQGTHDGTSNLVSNALKGAWGVEPTSWPTPATPTDNGNVFTAPSGYTKLDPAVREWQICLKCHSNYVTLPSGKRNLAEELNPNYPSTHGIVEAGTNSFCNTTTMNEPWATANELASGPNSGIVYCSDCHRSDTPADPEGPHGSNSQYLLVATIVSDNVNGTPLCDVCHMVSVYWGPGSGTPSDYDDHPATQGQHKKAPGCFSCHMLDHSSTAGLGLPTADWPGGFDAVTPSLPQTRVWIHGQNRKWVYNEQDGSAGSLQPVDNFINGYIANMDHGANRCWTETCKVHSNKAY